MRAAGLNLRQPWRALVFAGWVLVAVLVGFLLAGLIDLALHTYDGRTLDKFAIFAWAMIPVGLVAIPYVIDGWRASS